MTSATNQRPQQTLRDPVTLTGPGLFHGITATVRLLPAAEDFGICFRRTDLAHTPDIPARHDFVLSAVRRTVLGTGSTPLVETTEHLLAALSGLNVDNCLVELDAPEIPAFDGSSRVFCSAILETGLTQQTRPAACFDVRSPVTVRGDNDASLILRPADRSRLTISWHLDYGPQAPIPVQEYSADITPDTFVNEIAAARTFVLESEIRALKQAGYGHHLTDADLLVCRSSGQWNRPLHWPDECVRHKLLDCLGDLALSGISISGHLTAVRSGHALNHQLAAAVARLSQKDSPSRSQAA